jgi:N-acyl-phosphatidylethanolamine-hydrolysing phospholipase D
MKKPVRRLFRSIFLLAAVTAGCAIAMNAFYDKNKPHHTPEGFKNNYSDTVATESFWAWQWERIRGGLPKPPANNYQFPVVKPDLAWLAANKTQPTATWVGHATVLLQLGGLNILTDPHFGERASPVAFAGPKRFVPPGIALENLPHIDAVVISHNHYDHLDEKTVLRLSQQAGGSPRFFVGLGLKKWLNTREITNVAEMDWWDKETLRGVEFTFTPVQHWSARSVNDRFETLWGGWHIRERRADGFSAFFAGDTGYSPDFKNIARRLGSVDLGLIPVGAYAPRWFMASQHVDPAQAVKIHQDLGAKTSLGIHWGTFELTDEPLDEPPQQLAVALKNANIAPERFFVVKHGEMVKLR